ncbi:5657_t:CDS:1, partial [Racocetra persica]
VCIGWTIHGESILTWTFCAGSGFKNSDPCESPGSKFSCPDQRAHIPCHWLGLNLDLSNQNGLELDICWARSRFDISSISRPI